MKGVAHRRARLAVKCCGGTFELPTPIIVSSARWSQGIACLAQGRVPCISFKVALSSVFVSLLVFLPIALVCLVQGCGGSFWSRRMSRVVGLGLMVQTLGLLVFGLRVYRSCFIFLLRFFLWVRARWSLACLFITSTFLMKYRLRRVLKKEFLDQIYHSYEHQLDKITCTNLPCSGTT
jgi:hypothetical protein